ncbi:MAG TPA: energy transducer TonB [Gemmatimonadaceae bacterium]|nr:energy transducer TonB [Gemmatimonadaceae bacterium]
MLDTLVESQRARRRIGPGSLLSIAVHVAVISLLVRGGSRRPLQAHSAPPPTQPPVIYIQEPTAPVTGGALSSGGGRRQSSPTVPALPDNVGTIALPDAPWPVFAPDSISAPVIGRETFAPASGTRESSRSNPASAGGVYANGAVDAPAVMRAGNPRPAYPETLRASGITGTVRVQFVVSARGVVEHGSARVVASDNALFTAAVLGVLPRLRFQPAVVRGRAVRVLVEQTFAFELEG